MSDRCEDKRPFIFLSGPFPILRLPLRPPSLGIEKYRPDHPGVSKISVAVADYYNRQGDNF